MRSIESPYCPRRIASADGVNYNNAIGAGPQFHQARSFSAVLKDRTGLRQLSFEKPSHDQPDGVIGSISVTDPDHKKSCLQWRLARHFGFLNYYYARSISSRR